MKLTKTELDLVYRALLRNDGRTMCPDWAPSAQRDLTAALDKLRGELLDWGAEALTPTKQPDQ